MANGVAPVVPVVGAAAATAAVSLSMIVTVPVPRPIAAPVALDRTTVNASVGSALVSPVIVTENVSDVTPALNVSVEVFAVKSLLASAVPATVETTTVTGELEALDKVTVTFTVTLLLAS